MHILFQSHCQKVKQLHYGYLLAGLPLPACLFLILSSVVPFRVSFLSAFLISFLIVSIILCILYCLIKLLSAVISADILKTTDFNISLYAYLLYAAILGGFQLSLSICFLSFCYSKNSQNRLHRHTVFSYFPITTHVPGHAHSLQGRLSVDTPTQSEPPFCGEGSSQRRTRRCVPPSHVAEHEVHGSQSDHCPSIMGPDSDTANSRNEYNRTYSDVIFSNLE